MAEISNYKVAASPHKLDNSDTRRVMLDVLIALLPCLVCGVVFFGLYAFLLVFLTTLTCFVSEQLYNLIRKKPFTFDLSALVTGVILGLNLPPRAPWYLAVIGGVFAIIIVKMLFGGLGKNFANPAATARVFLLLAYSSSMLQYIGADVSGNILSTDIVTAPTYLSGGVSALQGSFWGVSGFGGYALQLLFGVVGGSIGETCKVAVLAGGVYLCARKVIDWRIPVVYLLTSATFFLFYYQSAEEMVLQLLSGGLMFGAVFMATDYATSPKWKYNRVLYAIGLGLITGVIRCFGSYPEGTSLAILFMNLLVPVMDKYILPVRFGQLTKAGKPKPQVMKWTMRNVSLVLVLAIAAGSLAFCLRPRTYEYILDARREEGAYVVEIGGTFNIGGWPQEREYTVTVDEKSMTISDIVAVKENQYGYLAELSLFIGKTRHEVATLSNLSTDSEFSATVSNTALRDMLVECFDYIQREMEGN